MKMNNITLIGMPGAGKSTLGVVLAKILGYEFLDSDLLIQKEEKRRLYQIIDEEGEEGFKTIENRVNASIDTENTVIATGGSVVYCSEAMEYGEAAMKETRIECFRAGESSLSYCLPQVLRITCSGVLRTLICSYLDTGKERCLKIGKSYKMTKLCVFLGSWILSPVMQCDQRHPLFLGGDGRCSPEIQADD